ncbi:MAG: uroporphyrin-III C-methyltransferase [Solirubrobacterales bacterium]|nr:uroporphyrin-III C-methyltransferase [Solirubrobacterales bacterium]
MSGRVFLVGAGPGDPGLMTVRAVELIAAADVVLFDKLIPESALVGARADAELIDVGKIGGGRQVPQDVTTALVLEHALAGKQVVRLKGGDPFVFGRGGEEALACVAAGVPFEVVPAVTSGIAAPAYAGIPVTQRGITSAVAFVTGHEDPDKPETLIDWPALARFPGTLCFYMGIRTLDRIAEQLVAGGRPAGEPVAVVMRGTYGDQRSVRGTLADIATVVREAGIGAPAITVVGGVAALHDELSWLEEARPLGGRTVAVTRARAQASGIAATLRSLGASVVEAPAIRIQPLEAELPALAHYDLVVVTSVNAVQQLFTHVRDARELAGATVAAIGPGTVAELRRHGIEPDVVPERSISEAVLEVLTERGPWSRVLIPRAEEAREVLPEGLRAQGAHVDVLPLYRTVAEPLDPAAREAALGADYLCFTSASSVTFFHEAAGTLAGPRLVTIGPVTSDAVRALGFAPHVEATQHDPDGLVAALVADARAS